MKVIGSIPFILLACYANASEIIVDDTPGQGDFTTIQAAELAASDGDTIIINPNSDSRGYREQITVTTPNLTITGSKSGKRRDRALKKTNTNKGSSKKKKQGSRELKGGKGGKGGVSFPFDALDEQGFPSLFEQPDCSDVFLDGCDGGGSCDNTVLTINAAKVTIENLFIRHGGIVFASGSDGGELVGSCLLGDTTDVVATSGSPPPNSITVSNNYFQSGTFHNVNMEGNSHKVSNNLVVPCDNGFFIQGDDGHIMNNKMIGCNDESIDYKGNRGTISGNEIYHSDYSIDYDGNDGIITDNTITAVNIGIDYSGDNGVIMSNKLSAVFSDASVLYAGDNPTITSNIMEFSSSEGIDVICSSPCTGGSVAYNEVMGGANDDEGIQIFNAKNFMVEYNTISYAAHAGLGFDGDNSIIRGNVIARCGTEDADIEHAMEIGGDGNLIEENTLNFNSYDGINQDTGNNNVFRRNTVNGGGRAGIRIEAGTGAVITDNTITNNQGEGISIEGGSMVAVRNNEVTNNRIDICNNVADTFAEGNMFSTGSFSTTCESGLS